MMTFAQIGAELGISPSTAFSHYSNALRKLAKKYPNSMELLRQMSANRGTARKVGACHPKPRLS